MMNDNDNKSDRDENINDEAEQIIADAENLLDEEQSGNDAHSEEDLNQLIKAADDNADSIKSNEPDFFESDELSGFDSEPDDFLSDIEHDEFNFDNDGFEPESDDAIEPEINESLIPDFSEKAEENDFDLSSDKLMEDEFSDVLGDAEDALVSESQEPVEAEANEQWDQNVKPHAESSDSPMDESSPSDDHIPADTHQSKADEIAAGSSEWIDDLLDDTDSYKTETSVAGPDFDPESNVDDEDDDSENDESSFDDKTYHQKSTQAMKRVESRKNQKWFGALFILVTFVILLVTVVIPLATKDGPADKKAEQNSEDFAEKQLEEYQADINSEDNIDVDNLIREENEMTGRWHNDPANQLNSQLADLEKRKQNQAEEELNQKLLGSLQAKAEAEKKLVEPTPTAEVKREPKKKTYRKSNKRKYNPRKSRATKKEVQPKGSKLSARELRMQKRYAKYERWQKRKDMQDSHSGRKGSSVKTGPTRKIPGGSSVLGRLMVRLTEKISKKEIQVKAQRFKRLGGWLEIQPGSIFYGKQTKCEDGRVCIRFYRLDVVGGASYKINAIAGSGSSEGVALQLKTEGGSKGNPIKDSAKNSIVNEIGGLISDHAGVAGRLGANIVDDFGNEVKQPSRGYNDKVESYSISPRTTFQIIFNDSNVTEIIK